MCGLCLGIGQGWAFICSNMFIYSKIGYKAKILQILYLWVKSNWWISRKKICRYYYTLPLQKKGGRHARPTRLHKYRWREYAATTPSPSSSLFSQVPQSGVYPLLVVGSQNTSGHLTQLGRTTTVSIHYSRNSSLAIFHSTIGVCDDIQSSAPSSSRQVPKVNLFRDWRGEGVFLPLNEFPSSIYSSSVVPSLPYTILFEFC
jgi:hypothetical protein